MIPIRSPFRVPRSAFLWLCLLHSAFCIPHSARAATEIQYYLTVTNIPAGLTSNLTLNIGTATTRSYSNNAPALPATSIQTTNTTAASATNLLVHLGAYPVYSVGASGPALGVDYVSSNTSTLVLTAPLNTNFTVTIGGLWARGHYVTNTYADSAALLVPTNAMSLRLRTNAANTIVNLLGGTVPSNSVPPANFGLRHYTDNTSAQTVSNKTFTAPVLNGGRFVNITNGTGTNVAFTNVVVVFSTNINGTYLAVVAFQGTNLGAVNVGLTNGFTSALTNLNPVTSNLVNYGNAIRSEGLGGNSLQLGSNAVAGGLRSVAIGNGASATNTDSLAVGTGARATNSGATAIGVSAVANSSGTAVGSSALADATSATAIGSSAIALSNYSIAIGFSATAGHEAATAFGYASLANQYAATAIGNTAEATAPFATALGQGAVAAYSNSVALGSSSATTTTNQVRLGSAAHTVSIPGVLILEAGATNTPLTGITTLTRLDLTARNNTSLANGYNSAVLIGTNSYVRFSGPTAAYTNAGFAAPIPDQNQRVTLQFDNPGLSFTLLNESGIDATAANRILTGTGALANSTNNPVMVEMIRDATTARWRLISIR